MDIRPADRLRESTRAAFAAYDVIHAKHYITPGDESEAFDRLSQAIVTKTGPCNPLAAGSVDKAHVGYVDPHVKAVYLKKGKAGRAQ